MPDEENNSKKPMRCFVIMGFGIKTDFATGRQLDLNKSYKILIKPVIESKGLTCIRADEIKHSGSIDLYMYTELLDADIVIADLSTANVNAFYELGIRHALRRRTTIVISEDKLAYPFDLNHVKITNYTHLGGAIDYEEVERFRKVLGDTIDAVLQLDDPDSPVYTHLQELVPPSLRKKAATAILQLENQAKEAIEDLKDLKDKEDEPDNPTIALLAEEGEKALKNKNFISAKALFNAAVSNKNKVGVKELNANDSYLIHRLAIATYKAEQPDKVSALKEALQLLTLLDIDHTNDPETVALAGKIEKRLYVTEKLEEHLSNAILYYERGYYLLHNRYHGINLAYLLNKRVNSNIYNTKEDKIADMIWASRTRRQVLTMCEKDWNELTDRKRREAKQVVMRENGNISADHEAVETEEKYWIQVNKAEAHFGIGEIEEYKIALATAKEIEHPDWRMTAFEEHINKLRQLMKKYGDLLNPSWVEKEV
ncbi:MAG: DUF4071 domain-containing protein [Chitinophagaceae bacterium]|nr:DUF4071 domain-containing protein [Chitinophagaceae bacterium]